MSKKNLSPFNQMEEKFIKKISENSAKAQSRFHLFYALLATFGLISVFYGFEKLIDRVDFFVDQPWVLLLIGLLILGITGRLYQKLD
jgi:hypothetical protein